MHITSTKRPKKMATLKMQREAVFGVIQPIPTHLRDAEEVDDTDISEDDKTLLSRVSEAACLNMSACPDISSKSFKEGVKSFYNQPELYHQRWKASFLANRPAFRERLLKSSCIMPIDSRPL